MSEKGLDRVIRHIRMAASYMQIAEDMADALLQNHTVANELHLLKGDINDAIKKLDVEYRESHFERRR
jgi:hypothetical protein